MEKKYLALIGIMVLFLAAPAGGSDAWRISLKNGGEFTTLKYWREGGEVRFYIYDGVMGIGKDSIMTIDKVIPENLRYAQSGIEQETTVPPSGTSSRDDKGKEEQEQIDIPLYMEKKERLAAELDRTLERLREATSKRDAEAKEREQKEMRRLTTEIYALTDEVKEKNRGKLPNGWWKEK